MTNGCCGMVRYTSEIEVTSMSNNKGSNGAEQAGYTRRKKLR